MKYLIDVQIGQEIHGNISHTYWTKSKSRSSMRNLIKFIERYNILFMYQFGFRKLHSTTTALIEITDKIMKLLDEGNYVIGIYLDLTKASDTANRQILLNKSWKYGIRGMPMNYFDPIWPTDDNARGQMKQKSIIRPVQCGVPQGSV